MGLQPHAKSFPLVHNEIKDQATAPLLTPLQAPPKHLQRTTELVHRTDFTVFEKGSGQNGRINDGTRNGYRCRFVGYRLVRNWS
jgi:hypothetical protein